MSISSANSFQAKYYDGQSSAQRDVIVSVDEQGFLSFDTLPDLKIHISETKPKPRIGNTARYIALPDRQLLETLDNDVIDALVERWLESSQGIAHLLESNFKVLLVSLFILVSGGFLFVTRGIPAMSHQFTDWLPIAADIRIAEEGLAKLDNSFFLPSELPAERRDSLRAEFAQLADYERARGDEHHYQILFRNAKAVGANAFAFPDGSIVVTDQLINLVSNDEEVLGILLHEIAHVKYRHAMQNLLRQAGISAIILLITGDVSSASSIVLMLPTVLLQSQYSQEFETESDSYALQRMPELGLNPGVFADTMEKISASHGEKKAAENGLWDYFSSHPPTRERIARFRNAAKNTAQQSE